MTFYFSSFFIHVIQAVPHTKYRRANLSPVNLDVSYHENSFCTVITQDCDIVHQKQEEEPFVEFIIGNLTQDKSCKNGKNPRKLHLENDEQLFEFNIHNRFLSKKRFFPDLTFLMFCTN